MSWMSQTPRSLVPVGVLAALVAVGCAVPAAAGAQALSFRHLTVDDGLPSSQVTDVRKDSRGFMWVSTAGGLGRYDGYGFKTYRHSRDDPGSLPSSSVLTVYEDRTRTLWVGTVAGLSRFDPRTDSFTNFMVSEKPGFMERRSVPRILEDRTGRFWIGTTHGLFLFDRRTSLASPVAQAGVKDASVSSLYEGANGDVWVGTDGLGLFRLGRNSEVHHYTFDASDPNTIPASQVGGLVQVGDRLWIATQGGMASLDLVTGRIERHLHDPANPASLATNRVLRLVHDGAQGLWIGTENAGIDFLDLSTGIFRHHPPSVDDPSTLNGNSAEALYLEPGGALWAGTFTGGLNVSLLNGDGIRLYRSLPGNAHSLSHNTVVGMHEDRRGQIWIATDGGGLNRFDRATGQFTHFNTSNSKLASNAVLGVTEDRDGAIWLGNWAGGVTRVDPLTGAMTVYTTATSKIPSNHIFSVHVDRANRLWVGTFRHGLVLMDTKTGAFTRYPIVPAGRESPLIWQICELADGRLALATGNENEGLVIFDPRTGGFRSYQSDPHDHTTLSSNSINAVSEERPGVLLVGTLDGLDRLTLATGAIEHFSRRDGLPGNAVEGMAFDRAGALWVSTDHGIARFDPATRTSKNFSRGDGLQGNEFVAHSFLETRDGMIFFGGANGFNTIDPSRIQRNDRIPPVVLTSLQLFGKPVLPGASGSPLTAAISETRHLSLSPDETSITIGFAALDFTDPEKNLYSYKLEGVDKSWIRAGETRSATYSHLPPGDFVFRVKGSNSDGVWNEEGASLAISIAPAIWERTWVRLMVLLLVLGVLLIAAQMARRRNQHLAAMNRQLTDAAEHDGRTQRYLEGNVLEILDAMQRFSDGDYSVALGVHTQDAIGKLRRGFNAVVVDRKQADDELRQSQKMEAVGRLAGGVAHDFNNLLTVIKGNIELALQDLPADAEVRAELVDVQQAAERAAMLTGQLLAFSRKQILQPQTLALNALVADVGRMLTRTLGEDIELHTALDPNNGMIRADPGQIQQVLLNLAVNARDAMAKGGSLTIEARSATSEETIAHAESDPTVEYLALSVHDTGEGMTPALMERIFEPFFTTKEQGKGTGLGLSSVYGIASQSGGYVRVQSEPGMGTTFTVYLPRVEAELAPLAPESTSVHNAFETVLLVEDEQSVRVLSARVLRRAGYNVLVARHGSDALEVAEQFPDEIHLLLTDVIMPGMNGRELAQALAPRRPSMRVLYVSGYTEDETIRHGVSGLRTAFLEKPFGPNALARKVREVLNTTPADAGAV
ncbi:MAG: two-component regulator propeller domain-containing protein [Gemmatimonadaceae bacterium]